MAARPVPRVTPEDYLVRERAADFKSEYLVGEIFARTGATREHLLLVTNLVRELSSQLRHASCETYAADMRVRTSIAGLYSYPDVVVVCGQPQFADANVDILVNPTVIVEVLSPSTEKFDRGEKFARYQQMASLQEDVLVSQEQVRVECYQRQGNGAWLDTQVNTRTASVRLASFACMLALADIYEKVEIASAAADGADVGA